MNKHIAWFLPRLHHNYIEWINLLAKDKGIKSTVYVAVSSPNEQRENQAEEITLKESWLSRWLGMRFGYGGANKYRFIVSTTHLWRIFKKGDVSTVVVRDPSRILSLQVILCCLIFRVKSVILYSQTKKIFQKTRKIKILRQFLEVLDFKYVSTIMPPQGYSHSPYTQFVPFIFEGEASSCDYKSLRILTISKFQKRKRLKEFLYQFKDMVDSHPHLNYRWLVIGEVHDAEQETYHKDFCLLIKQLNLETCVEIKRNLNKAEIIQSYNWCNLFVLASHNEPAAYSVIEALAHARPVLCDKTNGTHGYLHQPKYGLVFYGLDNLNVTINKIWHSGDLEQMHSNLLIDSRMTELLKSRQKLVSDIFSGEK